MNEGKVNWVSELHNCLRKWLLRLVEERY